MDGWGGGEAEQQKRRRAFWSCITDYWALMETAICRKRSKTVAQETASCLKDVENFYKAYKRTCVSGRHQRRVDPVGVGGAGMRQPWGNAQRVSGKMAKTDKRGINFKTVQFNRIHSYHAFSRFIPLVPLRWPRSTSVNCLHFLLVEKDISTFFIVITHFNVTINCQKCFNIYL